MITTTDVPPEKGDSSPAVTERERRLHGFAVLVAVGDLAAASSAWQVALAAHRVRPRALSDTATQGWLRHRVVEELQGTLRGRVDRLLHVDHELPVEHRARLRALGASDAAIGGLRALSPVDRGLVIGSAAEHLDVAALRTLAGGSADAARRAVQRAMRRYVHGVQATLVGQPWARRQPLGELAERIAAASAGRDRGPGVSLPRHADDPHVAFLSWLADGAAGQPEAAVAAHAMACAECRDAIAAVAALQAIRPGRSAPPAVVLDTPIPRRAPGWLWQLAAPATALLVIVLAIASGSQPLTPSSGGGLVPGLLGPVAALPGTPAAEPSAAATDGGVGSPVPGTSDAPLPPGPGTGPGSGIGTGTGLPGATTSPLDPSTGPQASSPAAPSGSPPPPASEPPPATQPPAATPPPTQPPATLPPPEPTPVPTQAPPQPTPAPPQPTPTAAPAANCSNDVDDDGDLLIDFLDPGCALFGNEFALP